MQRSKKRLILFIFHTSSISFRASFPCSSRNSTWNSIWASWQADLASCTCCTCYKMITVCLLLESFTLWRVNCKEWKRKKDLQFKAVIMLPKVTKMGPIIAKRMDYNEIGILGSQLHLPSKNCLPQQQKSLIFTEQ